MNLPTVAELKRVFSTDIDETDAYEHALASPNKYVRSQVQIGLFSPGAKGRVLNAIEAFEGFGWEVLRKVYFDDAAVLVSSLSEPANTLKLRREQLGLSEDGLAAYLHVPAEVIKKAETPGAYSPIRMLESIAASLALDERQLGFKPFAGADRELGVRLRDMSGRGDLVGFSESTVLQLAEAAWVIKRQGDLQHLLSDLAPPRFKRPLHDADYGYPAYRKGYELARETRSLLRLDQFSPISSMREIVEDFFGIPLVLQTMNHRFAGATISNGSYRGICINEVGFNQNIFVRRMTLCHELGHLLWDPEHILQNIKVDEYVDFDPRRAFDARKDLAEIRANAFAVAFLAPPEAVNKIVDRVVDLATAASEIANTFGISATAAHYHLRNVRGVPVEKGWVAPMDEPDRQWTATENFAAEIFPFEETPLSRRGKFSFLVAKAHSLGEISDDTARTYLKTTAQNINPALQSIQKIWES